MKSKKGMELTVNFLVTFILAIVLFGMGIYFARTIMGGGTEITDETYQEFDKQIGDLVCGRGESICISESSKTVERGKIAVFGVTIKNDLKENLKFKIIVNVARGYDTANNLITLSTPPTELTWMPKEDEFSIDPGDSQTVPVLVQPAKNAKSGKYSFDVIVQYYDKVTSAYAPYPDDIKRKFYVDVR